jgi:hypothetical protein
MDPAAVALCALLGQTPAQEDRQPRPTPAAASPAEIGLRAQESPPDAASGAVDGGRPPRPPRVTDSGSSDAGTLRDGAPADLLGRLKKWRALPRGEKLQLASLLIKGPPESLPPPGVDLVKYLDTSPNEQAAVIARQFLTDLLAQNLRALGMRCGSPFFMEDRRVDSADEVAAAWRRALENKRTNLLSLWGVEALTVSEMTKRYGAPPPKLSGWPLKEPGTMAAVATVSGRPVVLLLRPAGATWLVVGFHD